MKQNVLKVLAVAVVIFALHKANAQQSVEEFLKPTTQSHAAIDNKGPTTGSPDNPAYPYTRECTQTNPQTISCRTYAPALVSGGGKWFGPFYWIAPDPAPKGYKFQSASFNLPMLDKNAKRVGAPDYCYGNDNSPMVAAGDLLWFGHKNGAEHAYAICFIQREDATGPKWLYALQGQEGGCSGKFGGDVIYSISCRGDGAVVERAELDVVYVVTDKVH